MVKLEEEISVNAKTFANREMTMYVEMASLRKTEKDAKKALQDKSQEALQLEAKILPLRTNVIELEGLVEEMKEKMARLEERATQREVLLGQVEGELVEKVESFRKRSSQMMPLTPIVRGFKMPLLSLPACILRWILHLW